MKRIALVNTDKSPCPWTHNAACKEFMAGFLEFGYAASEARVLEDVKDVDILILSSHGIDYDYLKAMNALNPTAVYILWYYHDHLHAIPFKKFILTGEEFYRPPTIPLHKRYHAIACSIPNFCPLRLRANESPDRVGTYLRSAELNGCFMGTSYSRDWVSGLENVYYYDLSHGLLDYDTRRSIYLKSRIAFGFQHEDNIANNHVTQRIFEGMAYGCVVLSTSPAARDMTNGIVEYVATKEEFIEKYNYYLTHPEECRKKELLGYEWVRSYGTNRYAAQCMLETAERL